MLLTAREQADLATDFLDVQPDTATILRATSATDGFGGRSQAWSSVGTTRARVTPVGSTTTGNEGVIADALRDRELYRISTPASADVRLTDRLQVGSVVFAIHQVQTPRSITVERTLICERAAA